MENFQKFRNFHSINSKVVKKMNITKIFFLHANEIIQYIIIIYNLLEFFTFSAG